MLNLLNRQAFIRSRTSATVDRYGDEVWAQSLRGPFPCRIEHTSSSEMMRDRETVVSTRRAFLPIAAALRADDELIVDGITYRVDGDPMIRDGMRTAHHIEARIQEVRL